MFTGTCGTSSGTWVSKIVSEIAFVLRWYGDLEYEEDCLVAIPFFPCASPFVDSRKKATVFRMIVKSEQTRPSVHRIGHRQRTHFPNTHGTSMARAQRFSRTLELQKPLRPQLNPKSQNHKVLVHSYNHVLYLQAQHPN